MSRVLYNLMFVIIIIGVVGCSNAEQEWFDTKEDAINYGLNNEGTDKTSILSIETVGNNTLVFFEFNNSLGIGSIIVNSKRYRWQRNRPYVQFSGESPYSLMGFDLETENNTTIPIIVGKVNDDDINKIMLLGDGNERELKISNKSRFFYSIHRSTFNKLKIVPIED